MLAEARRGERRLVESYPVYSGYAITQSEAQEERQRVACVDDLVRKSEATQGKGGQVERRKASRNGRELG